MIRRQETTGCTEEEVPDVLPEREGPEREGLEHEGPEHEGPEHEGPDCEGRERKEQEHLTCMRGRRTCEMTLAY